MKERPILFSAPMVRADLEDSKTMTRRIAKLNASGRVARAGKQWHPDDPDAVLACPYGQPGDRLWVRETFYAWGRWETRFSAKKGRDEWHFIDMAKESGNDYLYAANGVSDTQAFIKRRSTIEPMYWKRPAIFMPRAASRITLEITGVRVERLQDITTEQIRAEGLRTHLREHDAVMHLRDQWKNLWASINGDDSWAANPWVWVVEFKRIGQGASA